MPFSALVVGAVSAWVEKGLVRYFDIVSVILLYSIIVMDFKDVINLFHMSEVKNKTIYS